MKKSKLITTLLLVVVLLVTMLSVFAACDPTDKKNDNKDPNNGKPQIIIPPDPEPPVDDPIVHYTTMEVFQKAVESIETPEQVLGLDFGIDFTAPDGKKTEIALKGNLYSKYHNELAFTIYQSLASQENSEINKERIFGIYMIDDKMYVDLGEDKAMLYLEDINPNYVVQLAESGIGMVGGLLDEYGSTINSFLDLIFLFLFQGDPTVEITEDGGENITMVFDVKGLLRDVPELLGLLAGAISLPVDLGPFVGYLSDLMPEGEYRILINFDADDNLEYLGVEIDNSAKNELTSLELNIDITDSKVGIPEIENIDLSDIKNFSLTNIQFSIDLMVGTQTEWVKDSAGNIVEKDKQLDVGVVVNDIMSLIGNSDVNFPRGLLLLEGGTGLRLSFAIDLDLNYKKERDENGALVDNNKIAIELFLLNRDGSLADGEGSRPQAGIYYSQGSLYVNLDNLLPNYLQNINLRVDTNLNTLISALVDMITNAIDGALGTDFQDIINYQYDESGAVVLSSAQDFERVLSTADADVLTYSLDEQGNYVIGAGFKEFVSQVAGLVGFNQVIKIDGSKIVITANDEMLMAIESLIGKELGFRFPEMIPEINLTINLFEGGLESIAVDTTVSGNLGFELKIHKFLIGYEDEKLDQRIEEGINIENTNYINSLSEAIDALLSGIILSTHFSMTFNKGDYNLAPLIASFGLDALADADLIWTFTDDFILDMSINMQIALDRDNHQNSTFVFELKADDDVKIGGGTEGIKFTKDTVLIGIYGYQDSIYIDLSGFRIANITLPKLKFDLNFSDVVFSLLDRVIAQLLTSMNVEGGDLVFDFDLSGLLGLSSTPATIATADGDSNGTTTVQEAMSAIILGVNADAITPVISMAAIIAVIKEIDGTLIDASIQEALELMEVKLTTSMGRKDGFVFDFKGNLVPVMGDCGEGKDKICVFYYDENGQQLPSHDANGKKIVYEKKSENNPNGYTTKKYNYKDIIDDNNNDSENEHRFHIVFEMGTDRAPVIVGNIPKDKQYQFENKAAEFTQYRSDLIEAIMETVGGGALDLSLTLYTHDNVMDLQRLINNVLANLGKRLEIPINLNLDDWQTDVKLLLQWDIDLNSSARSAIKLELQYRGKVLLGVYVYRNNLVLDLEGLGLFSAKLVNTDIVGKVFEMLRGYVSTIEGMDLNQIIGDLLKDLNIPTLPGAGSTEGDVATDDNVSTIGENLEVMDLVKYILKAVSIKDTGIALDFTSELINSLLYELLGLNLGIDITVDGDLDLFCQRVEDMFNLNVGVEDIKVEAKIGFGIGKYEDQVQPDGTTQRVNKYGITITKYDSIPEWDASAGRVLAKTMLDNLDLGLIIDIANNTVDANNYYYYNKNDPGFLRIRVWKSDGFDRLYGVDGNPRVTAGAIIAGIYAIDKAKYNNNNEGVEDAVAYVTIDYTLESNQMQINICKGIAALTNEIDIGKMISPLSFSLDLLGSLGDMLEGLFSSIDGMLDGMSASTQALATADDGASTGEPGPFDEILGNLDVIKLLSPGINVTLSSNGNFNVDVGIDPYSINKLIDDVLSLIFSKGTGKSSLLNLKAMSDAGSTGDFKFSKDHFGNVVWDRENKGSNDQSTFWGSFRQALIDIIGDIIASYALPGLGGLAGGVIDELHKMVIVSILPFAVFDEFHVGLNFVDGTFANVYITGYDNGKDIYDDNGQVAYSKDKSARKEGYYTQIWVYNMFKAVGDKSTSISGQQQGVVTWTDVPAQIDYEPYNYTDDAAGVKEIYKKYFTDKRASYQDGANGKIIKQDVSFYMKSYQRTDKDGNVIATYEYPSNNGYLTTKVTEQELAVLSQRGTYVIQARAVFDNPVTMDITINSRGLSGGIESVESFSMHVYDVWPDFITAKMGDGTTRKISTDRLTFWKVDVEGNVTDEAAGPETYTEHILKAAVRFPRTGQNDAPVDIVYLDSTVNDVIINGEAIKATDGNVPSLIIDLYNYNLTADSSVMDYVSNRFFFKYKDGKADSLEVNGNWQFDETRVSEFYDRITSLGVDGLLHNLDDADKPTGNLNGTAFLVTNKIGKGNTEQEVRFMVWIKTKNVSHLTVNGVEDTLRVDPYQYYMYLITGDESLNPFPSKAMANYYDEYTSPIQNEDGSYDTIYDDYDNIAEEVFIRWNRAQFSELDFNWNNDNAASDTKITVYLDNDKYEGNFTWEFQTKLVILRNEVQAIYFDDALTQTTYFIDPFDYLLRINRGETAEDIYPSEANVLFTNGTVRKMPIQWIGLEKFAITDYSSKVAQLQVRIGFDATAQGNLSSMIKGNLEQTTYVNVKVENLNPIGFDVAGSEYSKNNNGEKVFYIDPIQYLYYGVDPFPSIVTMVYESEIYENGKTTDLRVTWDFDRSLITMYGGKYQALIKISDDLEPYVIDVEVLDRSNLQVAADYVEIDPYKYKTAEDGSRIYSNFSSTSYIYQQVGVIDYTDRNDIKVSAVNTASGNVSDEFDTYVQYEVTYINGNNVQTVYRNKSLDMIADFFSREGASVEIKSAVVKQYYNVNVEWDLTEINYAISDVYKVKMTAKALNEENDKTMNVNVNVMAKEVEYVDSADYCIIIKVGATNLTEEERITKTMTRNLRVMFTDGTSGTYECTIDLSTVDFERYDVQAVGNDYVDRSGNVVENIRDQGIDVNVTVCSGDIAQVKTAKAVVVYEA